MKLRILLSALLGLLMAGCSSTRPGNAPMALFNGVDLTGWVIEHGGEWTVEDGALVGRNGRDWSTNPEVSGSWLRTGRTYRNFILELEFAIEGNSGI
ncbi:MAG: DUF1080 domain-containing protein, partial [Verrucomicrobiae bacterium]|nr:DUF1080 domain-containing protein [Verrucomicrobiae bacterium]